MSVKVQVLLECDGKRCRETKMSTAKVDTQGRISLEDAARVAWWYFSNGHIYHDTWCMNATEEGEGEGKS